MDNKKFNNSILDLDIEPITIENKEYFKAKDISEFFGFRDANNMTRLISDLDKHSIPHNMRTAQGNMYTGLLIDEYALYEICCKITRSDTERYEKAQKFKDWIFGEVIPSIRKYGGYIKTSENDTIESINERAMSLRDMAIKNINLESEIDDLNDHLNSSHREISCLNALLNFREEEYSSLASQFDEHIIRIRDLIIEEINRIRKINNQEPLGIDDRKELYQSYMMFRSSSPLLSKMDVDDLFIDNPTIWSRQSTVGNSSD